MHEQIHSTDNSKYRKALDGELEPLPNLIFKTEISTELLHVLFDHCFDQMALDFEP